MELAILLFYVFLFVYSYYFPKRSWFALPCFLPAHQWKIIFLGLPWNGLEVVIWILALATVFNWFRSGTFAFVRVRLASILSFFYHPLWLVLVFIVATIVLFPTTPKILTFDTGIPGVPQEVYYAWKVLLGVVKGWLIPSGISTVFVAYYMESKEDIQNYMLWIAAGVAWTVGLGLLWTYVFQFSSPWDGRFAGIFVSPNYLVFLVLPVWTWLVMQYKQYHKKVWYWVVLVLLSVGLILARSYASWIVASVIVVGALFYASSARLKALVLLLFLVCCSGLFWLEGSTEKFQKFTIINERSSTAVRLEVYHISLQFLKEHPFLGIGAGLYEPYYKIHAHRILGHVPYEWVMLHPHNLYLAIYLSFGLLGIFAFIVYMGRYIYGAYKNQGVVILLPLLTLFLHGIVDTPFLKLDVMLMFFLFCTVQFVSQFLIKESLYQK